MTTPAPSQPSHLGTTSAPVFAAMFFCGCELEAFRLTFLARGHLVRCH